VPFVGGLSFSALGRSVAKAPHLASERFRRFVVCQQRRAFQLAGVDSFAGEVGGHQNCITCQQCRDERFAQSGSETQVIDLEVNTL